MPFFEVHIKLSILSEILKRYQNKKSLWSKVAVEAGFSNTGVPNKPIAAAKRQTLTEYSCSRKAQLQEKGQRAPDNRSIGILN